jgi:LCP family protein required for cell wall assembly
MHRHHFVLWVIVLIASSGIFLAILTYYQWDKPLGASLDLPTQTPYIFENEPTLSTLTEQATISNSQVIFIQSGSNVEILKPVSSPTATMRPLCGGPKTMTILAIGSDERSTGYEYGLADSIHVMRIDFSIPNIMVIDFPRDLWVEIPDIADHYGITHGKLNQAYLFGNPGMGYYDGPGKGPGLLARTLDLNFGMRIDHYLAVDTQTFVHMIDAVGGIDIKLDAPIDLSYGVEIPDERYYLSVGTHHLDGQMAYILATNRIPSTFQRMEHQKMVLGALREKLLSPAVLSKIPQLVSQFIASVQTDLSPSEINSLICIAQAVPKENIRADSFPEDLFKASSIYDPSRKVFTFIYAADFEKLRLMVAQFSAGIWPMQ